MLFTLLKGFMVTLSLICAIGAQNAFVLKQGLLKNHIFWICTVCFLCDFLLICLGVFGIGQMINNNKYLLIILTLFGAIFLLCYGFLSFNSAFKNTSSLITEQKNSRDTGLLKSIVATLAITLLNPHVYLDTVVIIGGVSATLTATFDKLLFIIGALSVSFIWFYSLGYGAQKLSPYLTNPKCWRIIEFLIGVMMCSISISLLIFLYTTYL